MSNSTDNFSTAAAIQQIKAAGAREVCIHKAERLRALADEAEVEAAREPDVIKCELLTREAATFRWAAVIVDVHEEVTA